MSKRLTPETKAKILKLSEKLSPAQVAEELDLDVKTVNYVKWSEGKKAKGADPFKYKKERKPARKKKERKAREVLPPAEASLEETESDDEEVIIDYVENSEEAEAMEGHYEKKYFALYGAYIQVHMMLVNLGYEVSYEKAE